MTLCVQQTVAQRISSVLNNGRWVKIAVTTQGVCKIPYSKLSEWGFDSPKNVRVFGNDFGMLPFMNNAERPIDLVENKVLYGNDAIYFYANSKDIWHYSEDEGLFLPKTHLYDNRAYYFLSNVQTNINNNVIKQNTATTSQMVVNQGDFYAVHEIDDVNLQMSGRNWYGENFYYATQQNISIDLPTEAAEGNAKAKISVIARSSTDNSFDISFNGATPKSIVTHSVSNSTNYADVQTQVIDFKSVAQISQNVDITFNKTTPSAEGYLDYIIINVRGNLVYKHKQLIFRDLQSYKNVSNAEFQISGVSNDCIIWNVTNPTAPFEVDYTLNNGIASFKANTQTLNEFVVFSPDDAFIPEFVENVANQNIKAQPSAQMIIITPTNLKPWADKIAALHSNEMSVIVTPLPLIYNEFSCGAKDVSAIRDYLRYMYKNVNGDSLRYVLLFGDGSVDNITESNGNTCLVPTYQSPHSLDEGSLMSFVSDDYFTLLDDDEGEYFGLPDIAIGRIPVKNETEAETAVNKIELYINSSFGNWEKNIVFIADDENQNIHVNQADQIAQFVEKWYPEYNVAKIYIDAYPRQQTLGGNLYPQAREDILKHFTQGAKIINFTGHGGINYLTDERILTNADIDNLNNINNLPVFITSSCDVGRFDYYERQSHINKDSPAERALHNPHGGAIAMITAARHAFSEQNFTLNQNIFNHILHSTTGKRVMRLGDVVMLAKRQTNDDNMRCFILLGDPAIALHNTEYLVKILKINDIDTNTFTDTIKALSKCRLECAVTLPDGTIAKGFNGKAHTVFFDKKNQRKTLNNSGHGVVEFTEYNKKLFDGYSSISGGRFSVEFVVPKDIDYKVDSSKISFYANDGNKTALGVDKKWLVGLSEFNAEDDRIGPEIELFLNSTDFSDGENVNQSPLVIAKLSDS